MPQYVTGFEEYGVIAIGVDYENRRVVLREVGDEFVVHNMSYEEGAVFFNDGDWTRDLSRAWTIFVGRSSRHADYLLSEATV